jgi:hypothetical protein
MAKGKRPKPYVEGPRKQMTIAWKRLVLTTLETNKREKRKPGNLSQMSKMIPGSDKTGIYRTFDPDMDPPQMSSAYVDEICELLRIPPPMAETSDDPNLERDLDVVRAMPPEVRRAWIDAANASLKRGT